MTSKVGPKGQVVIPKPMRDSLGISPGDEVQFVLEDGGVRVEPVPPKGSLRGRFAASDLLGLLKAERQAERRRDKRR